MSASIVAQLLWLESDTPDKPITMYINSPGGSVTSGALQPAVLPESEGVARGSQTRQAWPSTTP